MPVRSFVPIAVSAVLILIALLALSVVCVVTGVHGDGFGWGLLVLSLPFTGFFTYIVYRIPRRITELREWERSTDVDHEAAEAPFAWLNRRAWRFRWIFVGLLAVTAANLAVSWPTAAWFWKAFQAACCLVFLVALVVGRRQATRDRAAVVRADQ